MVNYRSFGVFHLGKLLFLGSLQFKSKMPWLNSFNDVRANLFQRILTAHENSRHASSAREAMVGQMATAMALPGFHDLGRSVTLNFLLMDHFLYRFSTSSENMKKIYRFQTPNLNFFAKYTIEFCFFSSSIICAAVSNVSWMVKFCKNVGNICNYLRNRPTTTKYDWDRLPPLTHL